MNKELANKLVSKIEANMTAIENVVKENLGVEVKFEVELYGQYDTYVALREDGHETTKQLTVTPLLYQMFKDADIIVRCWLNEQNNIGTFRVEISYRHNFNGGSNGIDLMVFDMDMENGKVTAIRK